MKRKQKGFVLIESIISLSIICLAVYIVSGSLYDSYNGTIRNQNRIEMLNTAKQYLEEEKHDIKYKKDYYVKDYQEVKYIGEYSMVKTVKSEENYYQCYKIDIEIKNDKDSINLQSYVFKQ